MQRWINRYYYILHACGINRKGLGITSHGLRHAYAQGRYEALSGRPAPVKHPDGDLPPLESPGRVREARQEVAEELGHGREYVLRWYLGRLEYLGRIDAA